VVPGHRAAGLTLKQQIVGNCSRQNSCSVATLVYPVRGCALTTAISHQIANPGRLAKLNYKTPVPSPN